MNLPSLKPEQLRKSCDTSLFDFKSADELPELSEIIGQERAVEAVEFGMSINGSGYNIFALGSVGAGRTSTVKRFVTEKAKEKPTPDDWCYVHNFKEPHKPIYLRLSAGKGREFRSDMENFISVMKKDIQRALEREDFETERNAIMQQLQKQQSEMLSALEQKVKQEGFMLDRGPTGFYILPVREGKPMGPREYGTLWGDEKKQIEEKGQELQKELHRTVRKIREMEMDAGKKLQDLERNTVLFTVEHHIEDLKEKYESTPVKKYLESVKEDIVSNARNIMSSEKTPGQQQQPILQSAQQDSYSDRYKVNLIVDNSETEGAPVVMETNPSFQNLIGRIERQAQFGMLTTNFNLIKGGALHRANGGFLILEAEAFLMSPFSYHSLKRAFKDGVIKIYDISEFYSMVSTTALEPQPIPLDVKVVIIGNPMMYYLLYSIDEEFHELFKVKAEFNTYMERTPENEKLYARFLALRCKEDGLCQLDNSGIARVVEYGSELVGDQTRLSTKFADICDIARQASYWACEAGEGQVTKEYVQKAIDARDRRSNRIEEMIQEMIERGDIFIDTTGEVTGQINGLSVITLGDYTFGKPSRITARTFMGKGDVINIEREVKMSGPIHNKGVLILRGYLNGRYGQNIPLFLAASIGFEQTYEGVEGDSASSSELYALLSSLSDMPVKQSYAVTGSVNQHGEIQPVGGVTWKIEGFYDVCKAKGLTGDQGVLIPRANIKNLMLGEEVVNAVKEGKFHIYSVDRIEQGIEILTGREAGEMQPDGTYPEGTINFYVEKRLTEFAERFKEFKKN